MPILSESPFERANLALAGLIRGDVSSATTGAFSPSTLSPDERKSMVDRYLGGQPGPLHKILNVVTNPMVLVGLALTLRYPIASADRMLQFGDRLTAYAKKQFPGMSFLSDFREIFKGGPLPDLLEYVTRTNHNEKRIWTERANNLLVKFQEDGGSYTKAVGARISAHLDGLDKGDHPVWEYLRAHVPQGATVLPKGVAGIEAITLTPAEQKLADGMRGLQRSQFGTLKDDMLAMEALSRQAATIRRRRVINNLQSVGFDLSKLDELDNYFPHIEALNKEALRQKYTEWLKSIDFSGKRANMENMGLPARSSIGGGRLLARQHRMLPFEDDLQAAGLLKEDVASLFKMADHKAVQTVEEPLRRYSLDLLRTHENYVRGLARATAWNAPIRYGVGEVVLGHIPESAGEKIVQEYKDIANLNPVKANILKDTYIPMATGQLSWEQSVPSMKFSQAKDKAAELLRAMPGVPQKMKDFLVKPLEESQSFTYHRVGGAIQNYLYASTLSLNVVSSVKNLFQTVTTTIPAIGLKYTARGMQEVAERGTKYAGYLRTMSKETAFAKAFPEFHETGFLPGTDRTSSQFYSLIEESEPGIRLPNKYRRAAQKTLDTALLPFTTSERFNRLTAFYGARAKAMEELPGKMWFDPLTGTEQLVKRNTPDHLRASDMYANTIAHMTQFGGGVLGTPHGVINWWGPIRQFSNYPLRSLGYALGPGTSLGGGGRFNPGTLGRVLAASGVAYEAGQQFFNTDLNSALFFGGIPTPRDNGPFAPVPVSPFLQVLGDFGLGLAKGDLEEIRQALPLMVPGGIALGRASTVIAPKVARAVHKPYAQYDSPTPDGRIPVYSGEGQLQGYYTPGQLWARAIGWGDVAGNTEQTLMKYMLSQRDRIRGMRRALLDAMVTNDSSGISRVEKDYQSAYPGLGKLTDTLKPSDIRAVQFRREVPRLERLMATMPPDQRAAFANVISTSFGAAGPSYLGIEPSLLGSGTPLSRMSARVGRPKERNLASQVSAAATPGSTQSAGQSRRDELAGFGMEALGGFQ